VPEKIKLSNLLIQWSIETIDARTREFTRPTFRLFLVERTGHSLLVLRSLHSSESRGQAVGVSMMKELKTGDELLAMLIEAVHKNGKYATLTKTAIFIHQSSEPYTNWDYGTNTKLPEECRRELNNILGELRVSYDMK
jgi:hypothetical protein